MNSYFQQEQVQNFYSPQVVEVELNYFVQEVVLPQVLVGVVLLVGQRVVELPQLLPNLLLYLPQKKLLNLLHYLPQKLPLNLLLVLLLNLQLDLLLGLPSVELSVELPHLLDTP
jgi:hypothetical protein